MRAVQTVFILTRTALALRFGHSARARASARLVFASALQPLASTEPSNHVVTRTNNTRSVLGRREPSVATGLHEWLQAMMTG